MVYELREQPWFGLYVSYEIMTTTFLRLPFWYLLCYPRSWRPRPSWTVKRSVLVKLFRHLFGITLKTGALTSFPTHRAIQPGPGVKGVWVEAAPHLITGVLLSMATAVNVGCAHIPGYWIDADETLPAGAPPRPGEKVLYRLHGGAYIQLSAHPTDPTANIAHGILKHSRSITRTFSIEYRLSTAEPYKPEHPFPAALLDAIAGYNYLVNEIGFDSSDIIIVGDSAGGNLALALIRYMRDHQQYHPDLRLPRLPAGLVLLSPWADLGRSHEGPNTSLANFYSCDYTGARAAERFSYAKHAFLGPFGFGFAERSVYISPASLNPWVGARFEGFPRTLICSGGAEPLLDSIRSLLWKMERDMGSGSGEGQVCYHEAKDSLHDHLVFPWHEPENGETLTIIADWIDHGWRDSRV